jgi:ribonucleoside-diphosphate reductase beta chain
MGLLCNGLGKSNELIARDEGLHRDFACALFAMLTEEQRPSLETIKDIIMDCVEVERQFVTEALPVELIGMNSKAMCKYVEFVADSLCQQLGIEKIYNTKNPFDFMESIALQGKTNFFESRVTEYARAGFGAENDTHSFSLQEDF